MNRKQLDRALVKGVAWTGAAKWVGQMAAWTSTILVARYWLGPEDYGLVGMATVLMGLVTLLSEFGIGAAIVTLRGITPKQIAQINTFSVMLGLMGFGIVAAMAVPIGRFFGSPQLPKVIAVLGITFLIGGFRTVPYALMQRDLQFKKLAVLEATQAIFVASATIFLAWMGFDYWTLVIAGLLNISSSTAANLYYRRHRFAWPRRDDIAPALRYSWHVFGARIAWYVYSNADFFVAGKLLGKVALGAYQNAWSLANVPIEKITALVVRVTPAIFATVQDDAAALRRYVLTITEGLALVTIPAALGLALVSHDFVLVVLGEKWRAMIVPLQLIAVYATVRSISPLIPQVLQVTGDARYTMRNNLLAAVLLPLAFVLGSRWGTAGIAGAWIAVHPLILIPIYRVAFRRMQLPARQYLAALWPAMSGGALMAAAVLAVHATVGGGLSLKVRLATEVSAGAVAYALTLLLWHRQRLDAMLRILKSVRR